MKSRKKRISATLTPAELAAQRPGKSRGPRKRRGPIRRSIERAISQGIETHGPETVGMWLKGGSIAAIGVWVHFVMGVSYAESGASSAGAGLLAFVKPYFDVMVGRRGDRAQRRRQTHAHKQTARKQAGHKSTGGNRSKSRGTDKPGRHDKPEERQP